MDAKKEVKHDCGVLTFLIPDSVVSGESRNNKKIKYSKTVFSFSAPLFCVCQEEMVGCVDLVVDGSISRKVDTEESLDLLRWFAFRLRKEEDGEQDTEDTETAKHPKGTGTADGVLNIDKSERDDES